MAQKAAVFGLSFFTAWLIFPGVSVSLSNECIIRHIPANTILLNVVGRGLEIHGNGTKLTDSETMLGWAGSMTWKGLQPVVKIPKNIYEKGISLSKAALRQVEKQLKRNPSFPKWDECNLF